ncbi:MAG: DUF4394 domain-containing protein [Candidatus Eisenbacteria bacterium]
MAARFRGPGALSMILAGLLFAAPAAGPARAQPGDGIEFVALTPGNVLVRFRADTPAQVRAVPVKGIKGILRGIDVRPARGRLYGITATYEIYAIDPASGQATRVSTLTAPFDGGEFAGMDFNPQSDRLRLVGIRGHNLRVHTDLGAAATDGPLTFAPGDRNAGRRPRIVAAAYTRSLAKTPETKLFDIDEALDVLVLQDPPNNGVLRTVGPLGADFGPESGFDIVSGPGPAESAWAASAGQLYRIDLATGAARPAGAIGDGKVRILALAALLSSPGPRANR